MNRLLDLIRRLLGVPAAAPPPPPAPPATLVAAFNAERSRAGLAPLVDDPALGRTGSAWAAELVASGRLSHDGFAARIGAVHPGVPVGEVVAGGYPDVASVVAGWMASPGHRAEILGSYDHAGGGSARASDGTLYWCGQFARLAR